MSKGDDLVIKAGGMTFVKKDNFEINTSSKHHFIEADREAGVAAIRQFVTPGTKEDAWLYVEGVTGEGKEVKAWFECGTSERADNARGGEASAAIDDSFMEGLLKGFKTVQTVSLYHQHPEKDVKAKEGELAVQFHPPSTKDAKGDGDLATLIDMSKKFKGMPFDFRVVTTYGEYVISVPADADIGQLKAKIRSVYTVSSEESLDPPHVSAEKIQTAGFDCKFNYYDEKMRKVCDLLGKYYQAYAEEKQKADKLKATVLGVVGGVNRKNYQKTFKALDELDAAVRSLPSELKAKYPVTADVSAYVDGIREKEKPIAQR